MKRVQNLGLLLLVICGIAWGQTSQPVAPSRSISLETADGGTMVTRVDSELSINQGSTLQRRWFVLNDTSSPVMLSNAGIGTKYESYGGIYESVSKGTAEFKNEVRAYQIVFVNFDIWGDRMQSLVSTHVTDVTAGSKKDLKDTWFVSESDVREMYTTVAFVESVMMADGSIYHADRSAIAKKLNEVQLHISESGLSKDPPKGGK